MPQQQTAPDTTDVGDVFKARERMHRAVLPADEYVILRLDGRAFHTYCRDLNKPYDLQFMADMDAATLALSEHISGVRLAYVQSDEISLIITAWTPENPAGQLMFGGATQKLVSVTASRAASVFNRLRPTAPIADFDARVFTLPTRDDVRSYLAWRQSDARRNTLSMLARTVFSARTLHGLSSDQQRQLLRDNGHEPNTLPARFRNGRVVVTTLTPTTTTFKHGNTGRVQTVETTRRTRSTVPAPNFVSGDGDHLIPAEPPTL
ncbi:tRNA(His) guanylyltransferase Thg1 family protein [Curtobacterium sp. MCBD17_040]|uniref:tRNA(His) guanylyltransferase Thg1 family protein n=1 Tax=Curtobacterium sp. MCBD17_040 TaxID=2175674 RepID=UPI000DAA54BA|nr:tRNA(His) guanylyltransferase Thg1 family protein [Curtobacterium sp. MCBD17_040]WIB65413.1 tRNA(His) guanylyltransferase Thg1 family protein [Curtobacterium sp. MCBD17_040]